MLIPLAIRHSWRTQKWNENIHYRMKMIESTCGKWPVGLLYWFRTTFLFSELWQFEKVGNDILHFKGMMYRPSYTIHHICLWFRIRMVVLLLYFACACAFIQGGAEKNGATISLQIFWNSMIAVVYSHCTNRFEHHTVAVFSLGGATARWNF